MTKLFNKVQMQTVLKDLRSAGYEVTRLNSGYEVKLDGETVLKAMNGNRAYLVTYNESLLTAVAA